MNKLTYPLTAKLAVITSIIRTLEPDTVLIFTSVSNSPHITPTAFHRNRIFVSRFAPTFTAQENGHTIIF